MTLRYDNISQLPEWAQAQVRARDRAAPKPVARQKAVAPSPLDFTPQRILWDMIEEKWPGRASWELSGAIPGRKFRIDIAFKPEKVAIEVDGLKDHTSIKGYRRDRVKDVLLVRLNWSVLRFTPGQIRDELPWVLESIEEVLTN